VDKAGVKRPKEGGTNLITLILRGEEGAGTTSYSVAKKTIYEDKSSRRNGSRFRKERTLGDQKSSERGKGRNWAPILFVAIAVIERDAQPGPYYRKIVGRALESGFVNANNKKKALDVLDQGGGKE